MINFSSSAFSKLKIEKGSDDKDFQPLAKHKRNHCSYKNAFMATSADCWDDNDMNKIHSSNIEAEIAKVVNLADEEKVSFGDDKWDSYIFQYLNMETATSWSVPS